MSKVKIKVTSIENKWGDNIDELAVFVDENPVGFGSYGGEPEDNSRGRDYSWVEPLIKKLAIALGAEVEFEFVEDHG